MSDVITRYYCISPFSKFWNPIFVFGSLYTEIITSFISIYVLFAKSMINTIYWVVETFCRRTYLERQINNFWQIEQHFCCLYYYIGVTDIFGSLPILASIFEISYNHVNVNEISFTTFDCDSNFVRQISLHHEGIDHCWLIFAQNWRTRHL